MSCNMNYRSGCPCRDMGDMAANIVMPGMACNCFPQDDYNALPYATAYVRPQTYRGTFCPDEALASGTAFPELMSPYLQEM